MPTFKCGDSALEQSMCMIETVMKDLQATYTQVGGGGITGIKLSATNTYVVSISQEERVDHITYELAVEGDEAVIKSRTESTSTRGG